MLHLSKANHPSLRWAMKKKEGTKLTKQRHYLLFFLFQNNLQTKSHLNPKFPSLSQHLQRRRYLKFPNLSQHLQKVEVESSMYFGLERTFFFFLILFLLWIVGDMTLLFHNLFYFVRWKDFTSLWPFFFFFKLYIKLIWLVLDFGLLGLLLSLSHISWVYNWVLFCIKNDYFSQILFKYSIYKFFFNID